MKTHVNGMGMGAAAAYMKDGDGWPLIWRPPLYTVHGEGKELGSHVRPWTMHSAFCVEEKVTKKSEGWGVG